MSTDEKREPELPSEDKEKEKEDEEEGEWEEFEAPVPPDGGWGWVVMISSFLVMVIVDGVCYTYSVFFNELLDYFGSSRSKTALVGALVPACYLLVGRPTHTRGHALFRAVSHKRTAADAKKRGRGLHVVRAANSRRSNTPFTQYNWSYNS